MAENINAWIESVLMTALEADLVRVSGSGGNFEITVVSTQFDGLRPVKKQQLVYAPLSEKIADGTLHAFDKIHTYTPAEWRAMQ